MPEAVDDAERLVRIETKLDLILTRGDDHETRIRTLERAMWKIIGVFSGIDALGVLVAIWYYTTHH